MVEILWNLACIVAADLTLVALILEVVDGAAREDVADYAVDSVDVASVEFVAGADDVEDVADSANASAESAVIEMPFEHENAVEPDAGAYVDSDVVQYDAAENGASEDGVVAGLERDDGTDGESVDCVGAAAV